MQGSHFLPTAALPPEMPQGQTDRRPCRVSQPCPRFTPCGTHGLPDPAPPDTATAPRHLGRDRSRSRAPPAGPPASAAFRPPPPGRRQRRPRPQPLGPLLGLTAPPGRRRRQRKPLPGDARSSPGVSGAWNRETRRGGEREGDAGLAADYESQHVARLPAHPGAAPEGSAVPASFAWAAPAGGGGGSAAVSVR